MAVEKVKNKILNDCDTDYTYIKDEFKGQGIVKRVISSETDMGFYYFVFVEKPIKKEEYKGKVITDYGLKMDGEWGEIKKEKEDDITYTTKNLRAYILLSDHGGYDRIQEFQDNGNAIYWPDFVYNDCFVDEADGDGNPEFYLTYFGLSDGLDSKPLKVIVYDSNQKMGDGFVKAKITAWYPAGNEDDNYRVEYNENWLSLPKTIKKRVEDILISYRSGIPGVFSVDTKK
ncbi:hypothetical protein ACXDSS_004507 [Klebsiella quasipneumoniae]